MASKLHGSVFIIVGLIVSIVSFFLGDNMVLFFYLGIGFGVFGGIRLFINGAKLKEHREIEAKRLHQKRQMHYHREMKRKQREHLNMGNGNRNMNGRNPHRENNVQMQIQNPMNRGTQMQVRHNADFNNNQMIYNR